MSAQKGGQKKLKRSPRDKGYYQNQFQRTAKNKAQRAERIRRRKRDIPKPVKESKE